MTKSISLVIFPLTLVCIAIGAPQLTSSSGLVVPPFTLIFGRVRPSLITITAFLAFLVNVARVERLFHHFEILYHSQLILVNHSSELRNLILRTTIEPFEILLARKVHLLLSLHARLEMLRIVSFVIHPTSFTIWCFIQRLPYVTLLLLKLALSENFAILLDHETLLLLLFVYSFLFRDLRIR